MLQLLLSAPKLLNRFYFYDYLRTDLTNPLTVHLHYSQSSLKLPLRLIQLSVSFVFLSPIFYKPNFHYNDFPLNFLV